MIASHCAVANPLPKPDPADPPWALFLDVDGTLLELADHPDAVVVPPELHDLLPRLQSELDGALALVSGRSLAALDQIFGGLAVDAAGAHGAEWRLAGKSDRLTSDAAAIAAMADDLRSRASNIPGTLIEEKGFSVAFHYRNTTLDEDAARALVTPVLPPGDSNYRLMAGKKVFEIVACHVGKGGAIRHFLSLPPYHGRLPVFAGDDVTDEDGFLAIDELGGHTIHVGEGTRTAARWRVPSVSALRVWLAGPVLSALESEASTRHAPIK